MRDMRLISAETLARPEKMPFRSRLVCSERGGLLPDGFWTAGLGKRPSRWSLHFDGTGPPSRTLGRTLPKPRKLTFFRMRPTVAIRQP